jgi:hypothetical protein
MKCSVRLGHGHAIHITQSCREYSAPGLRDGRRSSRKHAVNRVSVVDRNRGICWVSLVALAMCWAVQRGDRKNKRGLYGVRVRRFLSSPRPPSPGPYGPAAGRAGARDSSRP